ncbi:hypothetical protein WJ01_14750 [Burkholderia vietnamiensis]|nr:hypothetical protein WJ01_14750 [Burkholderia vietnamiensis]
MGCEARLRRRTELAARPRFKAGRWARCANAAPVPADAAGGAVNLAGRDRDGGCARRASCARGARQHLGACAIRM